MTVSQAHCSLCGAKTEAQIPAGDNRLRDVCSACGHIHYINPKLITGAIVAEGDKVLLAKRNIEPRKGYWTLPAGFMEMAETTAVGALRETVEETQAQPSEPNFYALYDLPHISQVYIFYRAELAGAKFGPTEESTDVALFAREQIPWDELAFTVVKDVLQCYFDDLDQGRFVVRQRQLPPESWRKI